MIPEQEAIAAIRSLKAHYLRATRISDKTYRELCVLEAMLENKINRQKDFYSIHPYFLECLPVAFEIAEYGADQNNDSVICFSFIKDILEHRLYFN